MVDFMLADEGLIGLRGVGSTSNQPLAITSARWAKRHGANVICILCANNTKCMPTLALRITAPWVKDVSLVIFTEQQREELRQTCLSAISTDCL